MLDAVGAIVAQAGWRAKSILKCKPFYSTRNLVNLYKSHVLSFIESRTTGIFHASPSVLQAVDDVQTRFLVALGVSSATALFSFNLAPLCARRDLAMLGFLQKVKLGRVAPALGQFFPFAIVGQRQAYTYRQCVAQKPIRR